MTNKSSIQIQQFFNKIKLFHQESSKVSSSCNLIRFELLLEMFFFSHDGQESIICWTIKYFIGWFHASKTKNRCIRRCINTVEHYLDGLLRWQKDGTSQHNNMWTYASQVKRSWFIKVFHNLDKTSKYLNLARIRSWNFKTQHMHIVR